MEDSKAQVAGIQAGDKIKEVNGKKQYIIKKTLDEVLAKCNGEELAVVIDRNGEEKSYTFAPRRRKKYNYTGIAISSENGASTKIAAISAKKSSQKNKD